MFWFSLYDFTLYLTYVLFPHYQVFLFFSISCFLSRFQTRDALHFSEDEDAVIVGSLDYYIDDCPWVSGTQYIPQRVTGLPDGTANIKDTVCESWDKCMSCCLHVLTDLD